MFSRKQYKQIGDILHERFALADTRRSDIIAAAPKGEKVWDEYSYWTGVLDATNSILYDMVHLFATDNPERFSPRTFEDYVRSISKEDLGLETIKQTS